MDIIDSKVLKLDTEIRNLMAQKKIDKAKGKIAGKITSP
jgi:hypothetical protein